MSPTLPDSGVCTGQTISLKERWFCRCRAGNCSRDSPAIWQRVKAVREETASAAFLASKGRIQTCPRRYDILLRIAAANVRPSIALQFAFAFPPASVISLQLTSCARCSARNNPYVYKRLVARSSSSYAPSASFLPFSAALSGSSARTHSSQSVRCFRVSVNVRSARSNAAHVTSSGPLTVEKGFFLRSRNASILNLLPFVLLFVDTAFPGNRPNSANNSELPSDLYVRKSQSPGRRTRQGRQTISRASVGRFNLPLPLPITKTP